MSNLDVETETKASARAVAKHELLTAEGAVTENEEEANGIRYTILANGKSFEWQYDANKPSARMMAVFGAKTLATNESSQVRNSQKNKGVDTSDDQYDAVVERFGLVDSGTWIDRTREPGERKLDESALFNAIVDQAESEGKTVSDDLKAKIRQAIAEDKKYLAGVRRNPAVMTRYNEAVGRKVKETTTDDLLRFGS